MLNADAPGGCTDDTPERRFARISARQHAAVSIAQAVDAGFSRRAIRNAVATGRLIALRPGVVAAAAAPPTWEQAAVAAALSAGRGAVASHETAAALWGLTPTRPDRLEISNVRASQHRLAGVQAHRSTVIEPDRTVHRQIPVTTVARTIIDLSARCSPSRLGKLLDEGLRRCLTSIASVEECASRLAPAPGRRLRVVRSLLDARGAGFEPGESPFEARVLLAIAAAGLPRPVTQHSIVINGQRYFIDLAYPKERVAIELDGWDSHRGRSAFDSDRARGNDVVEAGYSLLRFTWPMGDEYIVRRIATQLNRATRVGALMTA